MTLETLLSFVPVQLPMTWTPFWTSWNGMTSQMMLSKLKETCLVGRLRVVLLYLCNFMPCFSDQSMPDHLPTITTLRSLFTHILDFNAIPRRSFFEYLRYFTSDTLEREKLDEFLSSEGAVGNSSSRFLRATFLLVYPRTNYTSIAIKSNGQYLRY